MTDQEQIRRAAVYSGIMGTSGTQVPMHKLIAFAQMLLDEENEACAQVCDDWANGLSGEPEMVKMAEEIRMRRKA